MNVRELIDLLNELPEECKDFGVQIEQYRDTDNTLTRTPLDTLSVRSGEYLLIVAQPFLRYRDKEVRNG